MNHWKKMAIAAGVALAAFSMTAQARMGGDLEGVFIWVEALIWAISLTCTLALRGVTLRCPAMASVARDLPTMTLAASIITMDDGSSPSIPITATRIIPTTTTTTMITITRTATGDMEGGSAATDLCRNGCRFLTVAFLFWLAPTRERRGNALTIWGRIQAASHFDGLCQVDASTNCSFSSVITTVDSRLLSVQRSRRTAFLPSSAVGLLSSPSSALKSCASTLGMFSPAGPRTIQTSVP
jgi:hypothetical protein